MANFSPQQQAFIRTYSALTGLHPGVVSAQVAAEEPVGAKVGYHGTQDWLNVGITDSGPMGASNPAWRNPVQAAKLAAAWATGRTSIPGFGHASPSIVNAIRSTAGKSPQAQIAALQRSGWASSGYPNLPQLFNTYGSNTPTGQQQLSGALTQTGAFGQPQRAQSISTTVPTFDQAGFNDAKARYIAGSFVSKASPWNVGPQGANLGPNPLLSTGVLTRKAPNVADFQGTKTIRQSIPQSTGALQHATGALQRIAGMPLVNVHAGAKGYISPIPGAVIGRTDQGVDATMRPGAPIRALGDSRVVKIVPWYKGQPLVLMQLTSGPQAGKFWYVAEQIAPRVRPGQTVRAGQPIGTYASAGTGLELGWGSPQTPHLTLATAPGHGGYSEGAVTPEGANFRSFLGGLK